MGSSASPANPPSAHARQQSLLQGRRLLAAVCQNTTVSRWCLQIPRCYAVAHTSHNVQGVLILAASGASRLSGYVNVSCGTNDITGGVCPHRAGFIVTGPPGRRHDQPSHRQCAQIEQRRCCGVGKLHGHQMNSTAACRHLALFA